MASRATTTRKRIAEVKDEAAPRLRVSSLTIQPELVWDDGNSLTPGPQLNAFKMGIADVGSIQEQIESQVADIAEKIQNGEVQQ